jgi:hypothetical protein
MTPFCQVLFHPMSRFLELHFHHDGENHRKLEHRHKQAGDHAPQAGFPHKPAIEADDSHTSAIQAEG